MSFYNSDLVVYIITLCIVLFSCLYYFSVKTHDHWKKRNVPFCKPIPFFGNSMSTIFRKKTLASNQQEMYNLFPNERYVGIFMFRIPVLMLRDPNLIHRILVKDFDSFYDRGITTDERLDLLSLHLVNLRGKNWKSLRNKLTYAFSSSKLKTMCSRMEECVNALSEILETITIQFSDPNVKNVCEITTKFAIDVIGSCVLGLESSSLKDPNSPFYKMGREIFKPSVRVILKFITRAFHPELPYFLNLKLLNPEIENFFLQFIKEDVFQREKSTLIKKDFIQIVLELRKDGSHDNLIDNAKENEFELSDQVLASNVFAFFLGGFETVSSTMSFLLLELAANPLVQDTMRREILEVINEHNGELNYDTVKDMKYMEMAISETLRKYPIGTVLLRECTKTYQVPESSFVIEKGTRLLISVFALHHDPKYFADPERFDPERFSTENKSKIVQGTYLPFGDGPRICIGLRFAMMEIKYAFSKIIPDYEFALSDRMKYPVEFKKGVPLLSADGGIWLNIKRRK